MTELVSKEEFEEWLNYKVTRYFLNVVKEEQNEGLLLLINSVDMDSLTQSRCVGILSGLQKVLNIAYEDDTRKH